MVSIVSFTSGTQSETRLSLHSEPPSEAPIAKQTNSRKSSTLAGKAIQKSATSVSDIRPAQSRLLRRIQHRRSLGENQTRNMYRCLMKATPLSVSPWFLLTEHGAGSLLNEYHFSPNALIWLHRFWQSRKVTVASNVFFLSALILPVLRWEFYGFHPPPPSPPLSARLSGAGLSKTALYGLFRRVNWSRVPLSWRKLSV